MKPNQNNMTNGIMFFIPLSTFLITNLEIIGEELVLSYNDDNIDSQIRLKIYYEDRLSKSKKSFDENLMKNYHLDFISTYVDLIAYDQKGVIMDKLVFDFDPLLSAERGRIRFVLNDDYIDTLIKKGENEEVEFKGFQNLSLTLEDKNRLIDTIVSFANTLGGIILLGVDDDKKIIGFNQEVSLETVRKQLLDLIFEWCNPHIDVMVREIYMHEGQRLIMIHVGKGINRPYMKVKGRTGIFLRINESNRYCNRSRFDIFMEEIEYCKSSQRDNGRY